MRLWSRAKGGVSLAEIILCLGILAIVGLSLIGVFTKLLGSQSKSSHGTVGRFLLEAVAERAVLSGPPNWGMVDINTPQTESTYIHTQDTQVEYTYEITPYTLRSAPASNPMGTLYLLEFKVSWWGNQARVGMGTSEVTTTRVVYVED